ncbi:MAG: hypothetical protein ABR543_15795 [Gemmatimonadaceae bacterium]
MRIKLLLASAVLVVSACTKADTPAADTSMPAATETPQAPITLASVAGTWNFNVMGQSSDSVVATNVATFTEDPAGWSFRFPGGPAIPIRNVTVAGDSITYESGPFASAVRKGMQVSNRVAMTLRDGNLVGNVIARYQTTRPDSVMQFRLTGTRAQ